MTRHGKRSEEYGHVLVTKEGEPDSESGEPDFVRLEMSLTVLRLEEPDILRLEW